MDRGTGKTTLVCRWAAEKPESRVVVVAHAVQLRSVRDLLEGFGLTPAQAARCVIHASSVNQLRGRTVEVAVDEVDAVLAQVIGLNVVLATVTKI